MDTYITYYYYYSTTNKICILPCFMTAPAYVLAKKLHTSLNYYRPLTEV